MNTSKKGREFIESFEGLRLEAYQDSGGVWTIGYGHTGFVDGLPIGEGMTITREKADELFSNALTTFEKRATERLMFSPSQCEFDAMVSFAYNCGAGAIIKTNDKISLIQNCILYIHDARGNALKGLMRRRISEARLFFNGDYSTSVDQLTYGTFYEGGSAKSGIINELFGRKEEQGMTEDEKRELQELKQTVKQLEQMIKDQSNTIKELNDQAGVKWNSINDDIPKWARPTIVKLVEMRFLEGDGSGNLALTRDLCRTLVILDRAGAFDKK